MQTKKMNSGEDAHLFLLKSYPQNRNKAIEGLTKIKPDQSFVPDQFHVHQLNGSKHRSRFLIHTKDEIKVILFEEVICCVANSNYTNIYLRDGSKLMISKTLKAVESILCRPNFFRVHSGSLVNLLFIKRIIKTYGCTVELPGNVMLEVSRSRREELLDKMENL